MKFVPVVAFLLLALGPIFSAPMTTPEWGLWAAVVLACGGLVATKGSLQMGCGAAAVLLTAGLFVIGDSADNFRVLPFCCGAAILFLGYWFENQRSAAR